MFSAMPTTLQDLTIPAPRPVGLPDTIETRLWVEEHDKLFGLLRSDANVSPTFRFPDLIGACVSLVFAHDDAAPRIFRFLSTELMLRPANTMRRRESMWRTQYDLLLALQRSPANRHPNPKFQLDQLTTACVALGLETDASGAAVLRQARINIALRASQQRTATN
ncbi:MAG: hypothetical protein KGK18_09995 [Burkholderiales bacterium]|nr:hypothetical protein [Burkholderiales bacterium]